MSQLDFSVVIPAHNAAATISRCLDALQRQTMPRSRYEIIVVDDGSDDETSQLAEAAGATVIRQAQRGAAAARNRGLKAAAGAIICFTDADCFPAPDWLAQIAAPLLANPDIIGCKGVYQTDQREITARFVQVEYEDKYDRLRSQRRINFIDTYSAAYRRDVLLANNGFDENFFFVEDQELSFRLAARGYQMVFQPAAVVGHHHADSLRSYFYKKFMIGYWKAQIVSRFPDRAVEDSHTPQILKVQIGLMALLCAAVAGLVLSSWFALPLLLLLLAFVLTAIPFLRKTWPKDRAVTLAAPFLLAARALALGSGYGWGTLRPQPGVGSDENRISGLNYLGKRALDIAGSVPGLLFTLLVSPFIALAIKIDSPGPILFRQERIGQGGHPFIIYKFRSMRSDAELELESLINLEELEQPAFKLAEDPRVTRVGRFLRRWSLDELPQFWNVFRGDMSLIGPRPEESRMVAAYNDWHRRRLAIKPGITGPMQVNGRGDLPLDARVKLELAYIENYSIWQDLRILAKTIPAILKGKGAR